MTKSIMTTDFQSSSLQTKSSVNLGWLKTIFYGAGISMVGQVSSLVLAAVLQFMIARNLGAALSGSIALGISLMTLFANLSLVGLDKGIVRFFPAYSSEPAKQTNLVLVSGFIILLISLLFSTVFWLKPDLLRDLFPKQSFLLGALPYFLLLIPGNALIIYLTAVTQAIKRFDYQVFFVQILLPILKILVLFWVIYMLSRDGRTLVLGFVLATALVAFSLGAALWKTSQPLQPVLSAQVSWKPLLVFSLPLFFITIVDYGWAESQILILGSLVSSANVGIFNVALRLTLILTIFQTGFGNVFAPVIAELHQARNMSELSRLLKVVTRWSASITIPLFLVMFCFAEDVMRIFGEEFITGALVLQILALGLLFNVIVGPIGWFIVLTGHSYLSLINSCVALLINISVTILLTTRFGITGAAIAILLGLIVTNIMRLIQIRFIYGIHPFSTSLWKSMITGCIALLIGLSLNHIAWPSAFSLTLWGVLAKLTFYAIVLTLAHIAMLYWLHFDELDRYLFRSIRLRVTNSFREKSS